MVDILDSITEVSVDTLIPYTNNAKEHPDAQVKKIASSIKNYGWDQPIVIDAQNEIIKGHGRFQAAQQLGLNTVPVIKREDLSDAEAKASRIADNKTAESDWIDDVLETEIDILAREDEIDIDSLGFDDDEIDELLDESEQEIKELDEDSVSNKALEDIRIRNLYAGIGGNRKLWGDEANVTAVEYNDTIAEAYQDFYPDDNVIVDDAHEYLLEHFEDFDFIWTSPPCPTHSKLRKNLAVETGADPVYPDLKLYEEILLLQGYFDGMWVVENVEPWYDALIEPEESGRHMFWSNFEIPDVDTGPTIRNVMDSYDSDEQAREFGYNPEELQKYNFPSDYPQDKVINNMVHPKVGKAILESALS